jgi:hypothetical protein
MSMRARLIEQGNGFDGLCDVGQIVYVSESDDYFRIVATYGTIHTDHRSGNYMWADITPAHDITTSEWAALETGRHVAVELELGEGATP